MNKTSAKLAVARNIRFFRIKNRFSGRELAKRTGVSAVSISAYENSRCLPSLDVMFRLADVFDISVAALIGNPSTAKPVISLAEAIQAIIDHNARIGDNVVIRGSDRMKDYDGDGYAIRDGIVVVFKDAVIPSGTRIV